MKASIVGLLMLQQYIVRTMIERTLFSPDHEAFRDSFRRFCDKEIAPHHEAWEEQGYVDRAQQEHQNLLSYIESIRDKFHVNLVWFEKGPDVIRYLNTGQDRQNQLEQCVRRQPPRCQPDGIDE